MEPITNAVISIVIQKLYDSLANENQTSSRFKNEFEKMKIKLHLMKCFMADAVHLSRTPGCHMTVKAIVGRVTELVYEADDILLDCQTRAAYEENSILHGYTLRGWFFRHKSGNKLNQINTRIVEMEDQLRTYINPVKHMIQNSGEGSSSMSIARRTSHVLSQAKIIGLEEDTEKVIGYITRNKSSNNIGIVGMGGLGKTTIAQKVFNHKQVVDHFDERIWVSVSHKFSRKRVLTSILKQLAFDESGIGIDVKSQIQQILNNKKYLIVMDDVWNPNYDWWWGMSSYLPEGDKSYRSIIITTRNEEVATKMGVTFIHHARELNEEESWNLFKEVLFSEKKYFYRNPDFEKVGEKIVRKCNGFPQAIKTIAALLSSKLYLRQWKEVKDSFYEELAQHSSVSASLELSYYDLPAELKHCLLSFSIYPEECEINAQQLVYWWAGEGLVRGNALEEASLYLSELVKRCLVGAVKRGYDGRVHICKMHYSVREMVIKTSKDETFSSFDPVNINKPDINTRHLGYTSEMGKKQFGKLLENNSKLRAFILMENAVLPSLQGSRLDTIKSLRILDLSQNEQESINVKDLLQWIKYQKRLAYLNLRKVGGLKELPDWIGKLQNLKILVIRECNNLKRLAASLTTLRNLIVLDVENCPLENLPRGLGKLTKLQVLSGFKLGRPGKDGARLRDLKGLKELRELGIKLSKKDDIVDEEEDSLLQLEKLQILSIDTNDCEQKQVVLVYKLVPPPSIRELYLRSYRWDTTPDWVSPTFLPELRYLYIDDAPLARVSKKFWSSNEEDTWQIEGLCFRDLPMFQMEWDEVYNNMKDLRHVEVSHCRQLHSFPCDVDNNGIWVNEDSEGRL